MSPIFQGLRIVALLLNMKEPETRLCECNEWTSLPEAQTQGEEQLDKK